MSHRAHESGTQSQEHERQAALLAFEQERARQQQVLQAEHQAVLQVMQTERYRCPCFHTHRNMYRWDRGCTLLYSSAVASAGSARSLNLGILASHDAGTTETMVTSAAAAVLTYKHVPHMSDSLTH